MITWIKGSYDFDTLRLLGSLYIEAGYSQGSYYYDAPGLKRVPGFTSLEAAKEASLEAYRRALLILHGRITNDDHTT